MSESSLLVRCFNKYHVSCRAVEKRTRTLFPRFYFIWWQFWILFCNLRWCWVLLLLLYPPAGTLRVRVVYRDVRNVPRNHIRYVRSSLVHTLCPSLRSIVQLPSTVTSLWWCPSNHVSSNSTCTVAFKGGRYSRGAVEFRLVDQVNSATAIDPLQSVVAIRRWIVTFLSQTPWFPWRKKGHFPSCYVTGNRENGRTSCVLLLLRLEGRVEKNQFCGGQRRQAAPARTTTCGQPIGKDSVRHTMRGTRERKKENKQQ